MAHDVFISYSHNDKAIADAVCAKLEERKIRCWIAPRDIPPGATFADEIVDAIQEGKVLVLIWSSNTSRSTHILNELNQAFDQGITVIPFRVENVEPTKSLKYYIGRTHWLDALTPPLESHIERLAERILTILAEPKGVDAIPTAVPEAQPPAAPPAPAAPPIQKPARKAVPSPEVRRASCRRALGLAMLFLAIVVLIFLILWIRRPPDFDSLIPHTIEEMSADWEVVFEDDFRWNDAGWHVGDSQSSNGLGRTRISNGRLLFELSGEEHLSVNVLIPLQDLTLSDFRLSVDVQQTMGPSTPENEISFFEYEISFFPEGSTVQYMFGLYDNGRRFILRSWAPEGDQIQFAERYYNGTRQPTLPDRIEVIAAGSRIIFRINDEFKELYWFDSPTNWTPGLMAFLDVDGEGTFEFDNLALRTP